MIRIFAFYFLCVGSFHLSSAYDVPNETCYDAPAYDCVPGDFNLTVNATVCRTYATGSLNWTSSIACPAEPFYQCNMAQYYTINNGEGLTVHSTTKTRRCALLVINGRTWNTVNLTGCSPLPLDSLLVEYQSQRYILYSWPTKGMPRQKRGRPMLRGY
jgi:hypothetical protein